MTRLVYSFLLFTSLAHGESVNVTTGFAVGESGLNISVPGLGPNIAIKNNGNGQYQADFSVLKAFGASSVPTQVLRVNPAPGAPTQLTDSDSFFRGVGGPEPVGDSAARPIRTIR